MTVWEMMNRFKELSAKLAKEGLKEHEEELKALIAVLATILESHHNDILGLRSAVSRLEHLVRHPSAPP